MSKRFSVNKWYYLEDDEIYGVYKCTKVEKDVVFFDSLIFNKAPDHFSNVKFIKNDDWPKSLARLEELLTVYSEEKEYFFRKTIKNVFKVIF